MEQNTRYLLDTNICSYVAKAQADGKPQYQAVKEQFLLYRERCVISVTSQQELMTWLSLPETPAWQRENAQALLHQLRDQIIEFNPEAREIAAELSATLKRQGKKLEMADVEIAAIALQGGFVLVTHDRHFDRIEGLTLTDWCSP